MFYKWIYTEYAEDYIDELVKNSFNSTVINIMPNEPLIVATSIIFWPKTRVFVTFHSHPLLVARMYPSFNSIKVTH